MGVRGWGYPPHGTIHEINTWKCSTWYGVMVWLHMVWCDGMAPHGMVRWYGSTWYGVMVWLHMVWCDGMAPHGMVWWYGSTWYGVTKFCCPVPPYCPFCSPYVWVPVAPAANHNVLWVRNLPAPPPNGLIRSHPAYWSVAGCQSGIHHPIPVRVISSTLPCHGGGGYIIQGAITPGPGLGASLRACGGEGRSMWGSLLVDTGRWHL